MSRPSPLSIMSTATTATTSTTATTHRHLPPTSLPIPSFPPCQRHRQSTHPPGHSSLNLATRNAHSHHYDPVHNTDSWLANPPPLPSLPPTQTLPLTAPQPIIPHWGAAPSFTPWRSNDENQRMIVGSPHTPREPGFLALSAASLPGEHHGYEVSPTSLNHARGIYNPPNTFFMSNMAASTPHELTFTSHGPSRRQAPSTRPNAHTRRVLSPRQEVLLDSHIQEAREAMGLLSQSPPHFSDPGYLLPRSHVSGNHFEWVDSDDEGFRYTYPSQRLPRGHGPHFAERHPAAAQARLAEPVIKKVSSKAFTATFEKLDTKSLDEAARECVICYNEFDVENPEGETEYPVRLPTCEHVFGNRCIAKWLEDSDSCPYCRAKIPAAHIHGKKTLPEAIHQIINSHSRMHSHAHTRRVLAAVTSPNRSHAHRPAHSNRHQSENQAPSSSATQSGDRFQDLFIQHQRQLRHWREANGAGLDTAGGANASLRMHDFWSPPADRVRETDRRRPVRGSRASSGASSVATSGVSSASESSRSASGSTGSVRFSLPAMPGIPTVPVDVEMQMGSNPQSQPQHDQQMQNIFNSSHINPDTIMAGNDAVVDVITGIQRSVSPTSVTESVSGSTVGSSSGSVSVSGSTSGFMEMSVGAQVFSPVQS